MDGYYSTMYRILDKSSKVLFKNTSDACFSDLFFGAALSNYSSWLESGATMEIFTTMRNIKGLEETEEFWLCFLESIGFKFTTSVLETVDEYYPTQLSNKHAPPFRAWTIDLTTVPTASHLKFACHLLRHLFEYDMHTNITNAMKYHKDNPEDTIWQSFLFRCMQSGTTQGHIVVNRGVCRDLRLPDNVLMDALEDFKTGKNVGNTSTASIIGKYAYNNAQYHNAFLSKVGVSAMTIKTIKEYNEYLDKIDYITAEKNGQTQKAKDIRSW